MSTNLDAKILALQAKLQEKKKEIENIETSKWLTSCVFKFPGSSEIFNIQTITDESLLFFIQNWCQQQLNPMRSAGSKPLVWLNYNLNDWIADVGTRIQRMTLAQKKAEFKNMENTLESLLSNDAKADKILKEIESKLS